MSKLSSQRCRPNERFVSGQMKPCVSAGRKPSLDGMEKCVCVVSGKVKCLIGQDVQELKMGDSIIGQYSG